MTAVAPKPIQARPYPARVTPKGSVLLHMLRTTDPKDIEKDLMKVIPQESWIRFSHQVIWHGRRVCFARKPNCAGCTLAPFCPSAGLEG